MNFLGDKDYDLYFQTLFIEYWFAPWKSRLFFGEVDTSGW